MEKMLIPFSEKFMEVSERPHDVKQLFGEFYELLDADDYAGAEKK